MTSKKASRADNQQERSTRKKKNMYLFIILILFVVVDGYFIYKSSKLEEIVLGIGFTIFFLLMILYYIGKKSR